MSWSILVGKDRGLPRAVFLCNTSGRAFGPIMRSRKEAEDLALLFNGDPRTARKSGALEKAYYAMLAQKERAVVVQTAARRLVKIGTRILLSGRTSAPRKRRPKPRAKR